MRIHINELMATDWIKTLMGYIRKKETHMTFLTNEATFENVRIKTVFVNMFILQVKYQFQQPITVLPINDTMILSRKIFEQYLADIYLMELIRPDGSVNTDRNLYKKMCAQCWIIGNQILNFTNLNCNAYSRGVDIVELAKFKLHPEFQKSVPIHSIDFTSMTVEQQKSTEVKYKKAMMELINNLEGNQLQPFVQSGMLNQDQVYHTFGSVGLKTDINDSVMGWYIKSNYIDGLESNASYGCEALAGRKSAFYNQDSIRRARYFERQVQLNAMSVRNVYNEDCGSTGTVPFYVTTENKNNIIGKFLIENGKEILLMKNNIDQYVNRIVHLRSVLRCNHTDGVCYKCAGLLTMFIHPMYNIGLIAAICGTEPVSQMILSAKHLQNVMLLLWSFSSDSMKKYFKVDGSDIYVSNYGRDYQMVVDSESIKTFINVPQMYPGDTKFSINKSIIPPINEISVYKMGIFEEGPVEMKTSVRPRFSEEFVNYYRHNPNVIKVLAQNLVMIDLKEIPADVPIMAVDMLNDSTVAFFDSINAMFGSDLSRCTSLSEALDLATQKTWKKVNVNIMFIEILLRALMVTAENDYKIPVVEDPDNVIFGKLKDVNMFRSLSVSLTHEQHMNVFANVDFYKVLTNSDYDVVPLIEDSLHDLV